ncbi:MAG TPA: NAD(P)H-hydrate epimerase, partial [bacterium]
MKLPTPAEMAGLEQRCREEYGIPAAALMEQAGLRTAEVARLLLRPQGARRVVVLAGKGNNGGDGLVAARHLAGEAVVRVLLLAPPA